MRANKLYKSVEAKVNRFINGNKELNIANEILSDCLALQIALSEIDVVSDDRDHAQSPELINVTRWINSMTDFIEKQKNNSNNSSDNNSSEIRRNVIKFKPGAFLNAHLEGITKKKHPKKEILPSAISAQIRSLTHQAETAFAEKRYNEALELYYKCLKAQTEFKTRNHDSFFKIYWNLGNCYLHLVNQSCDLKEKVTLLESGIRMFENAASDGNQRQKALCEEKVENLTELLHYYEFLPLEEDEKQNSFAIDENADVMCIDLDIEDVQSVDSTTDRYQPSSSDDLMDIVDEETMEAAQTLLAIKKSKI